MRKDSWDWNMCTDLPPVMLMSNHELARAIHKGMAIDYSRQSTERAKKNDIVKFGMCSVCIRKVIFNAPATVVLWSDGTKTVVKCGPNDIFDKEKGLAMAIVKKMGGAMIAGFTRSLSSGASQMKPMRTLLLMSRQ